MNMMQAGAAAGVAVGNDGGVNPVAAVGNNYAKLSWDYTSLGGKPFLGTKDAIGVENWLLHCERIFADLGLKDMQKRRLASRQLQGAALFWRNKVTVGEPNEVLTWAEFQRRFEERFLSEVAKSALLRTFCRFSPKG